MGDKEIFKKLCDIVGDENISENRADVIPYASDSYSILVRKEVQLPDFVLMPGDAQQVQSIIRVANEYKIPVYPRSFGVNVAASALPYEGGLVVDLTRMDKIHEINEETMTATIEPGVSWGKLRKEANKKKLDPMPIVGPYNAGPVGNFLLTNITPYSTKGWADRTVTFECVLPNGEILRTGSQAIKKGAEVNPYFRYAYGPDIAGLFRGSLGNFGIITKLVHMLRPKMDVEKIVIYGFDDYGHAINALQKIERLDITRYSYLGNDSFWMHVLLPPQQVKEAKQREMILSSIPEYLVVVGLGGQLEQVALYEEMVQHEAIKENGSKIELSSNLEETVYAVSEGGSQQILRMFAPFSGFMPIIACVPVSQIESVTEMGLALVKKYDLKDPLSGGPLKPEILVLPYDRCSTAYVEQEILFDPNDAEAAEKAGECVREGYVKAASEYGGVHTMPNRSLLKIMNPSYAEILKGIKRLVDPNGIFMGGPYCFIDRSDIARDLILEVGE